MVATPPTGCARSLRVAARLSATAVIAPLWRGGSATGFRGVRRSPSEFGISAASPFPRTRVPLSRGYDPPPISLRVASRHPTALVLAVRPLQPVHPSCMTRVSSARRFPLATLRLASAVPDGCPRAGPGRSPPRAAPCRCCYPSVALLFRDARREVPAYI